LKRIDNLTNEILRLSVEYSVGIGKFVIGEDIICTSRISLLIQLIPKYIHPFGDEVEIVIKIGIWSDDDVLRRVHIT